MKQSGRASLLAILAVASVILIAALFMFSRESVGSVATKFLTALQKGDVKTLTDLSYLGNDSKEDMQKQWEFAVNKAGRYYVFAYQVIASEQPSPTSGSVKIRIVRNADRPGAYETNYSIPLIKVGEEWKVDVKGLSREIYPGLPR